MNGEVFDHRSEDVCVPEQLAIAVYVNAAGEITIRQAADNICETDDSIIRLAPANARIVADAILRCAAEIQGDDPVTSEAVTARVTRNADRQRRYRERQRNGPQSVTRNVTPPPIGDDGGDVPLFDRGR